jgi:hypothetical protein
MQAYQRYPNFAMFLSQLYYCPREIAKVGISRGQNLPPGGEIVDGRPGFDYSLLPPRAAMVMDINAPRAGRKSTRALTFPHPWGNFRNGICVPSQTL